MDRKNFLTSLFSFGAALVGIKMMPKEEKKEWVGVKDKRVRVGGTKLKIRGRDLVVISNRGGKSRFESFWPDKKR